MASHLVAAAAWIATAGTAAAQPASPATPAAEATAAPASAPSARPRRIELGGFLGAAYFGDDIELGNAWAPEQIPGTSFVVGARFAWMALPDLARGSSVDPQLGLELETRLALSSTGDSAEGGRGSYLTAVLGWRAHLLARLRSGSAWTPHVVVGLGGETLFTASPFIGDDTDAAFHWGPGISRHLSRAWDLRIDLRHGLTAGRAAGVVSTFELHAGLAKGWDLGQGRAAPPPDRDGDGDGIVDRLDECPVEPETVNDFRDTDGCPDVADRDGDGIMDPDDQCLDEPETANGIDDADGCPETDEDGDGRVGSADACPREAEDFDRFEDEDGCPELDNDKDGVPDASDVCPDQPETANGFDDLDGCPDDVPDEVRDFTGTVEGITFATGKTVIRPGSRKTLNKAAALLRAYPSIRMRIEGHTDDRGKRAINLDLALRRADAVRQYLISKGVPSERIVTVGHGPDAPRATNKTAAGRARNRRIEFHLVIQQSTTAPLPGGFEPAPSTQPSAPSAPSTQPSAPALP